MENNHSILIENARAYVQALFAGESSGHDYYHTLRVFKMATRIARAEQADVESVQLAALLHDVDDRKLSPETYATQANARRFLQEQGVDEMRAARICRIISQVSFSANGSAAPDTLEGKCVQDADRLDAIGAIGIARAFAYGGNHGRLMYDPEVAPRADMTAQEYAKSKSTTVNHFYEKLFKLTDLMQTPTAIAIAKARQAYMRAYIEEFMAEWDGLC